MARPSKGSVIERDTTAGTVYALRFSWRGQRQYITLGTTSEGWTRKLAEDELANTLAAVRLGQWQPAARDVVTDDPTLHRFASDWLASRNDLRDTTIADYTWRLSNHLLPGLGHLRLSQFNGSQGVQVVDRWRDEHLAGTELSAESVNKCLKTLGQILDVANERGLVEVNPLRVNPRNRKLKTRRKQAAYLDRAWQVTALLDAAGELDNHARADRQHIPRRVMVAVMVFAGLRISELTALRWRDIELSDDGRGRLRIRDSKTEAGERWVHILPGLATELVPYWLTARPDDLASVNELVFPSETGDELDTGNVRKRVFYPAVKRANHLLVERGRPPLPEGMTPHKLRHTYTTLRFALGHNLAEVASDLGHTDLSTTFRYYTHVTRLDEVERNELRRLVDGDDTPARTMHAHTRARV